MGNCCFKAEQDDGDDKRTPLLASQVGSSTGQPHTSHQPDVSRSSYIPYTPPRVVQQDSNAVTPQASSSHRAPNGPPSGALPKRDDAKERVAAEPRAIHVSGSAHTVTSDPVTAAAPSTPLASGHVTPEGGGVATGASRALVNDAAAAAGLGEAIAAVADEASCDGGHRVGEVGTAQCDEGAVADEASCDNANGGDKARERTTRDGGHAVADEASSDKNGGDKTRESTTSDGGRAVADGVGEEAIAPDETSATAASDGADGSLAGVGEVRTSQSGGGRAAANGAAEEPIGASPGAAVAPPAVPGAVLAIGASLHLLRGDRLENSTTVDAAGLAWATSSAAVFLEGGALWVCCGGKVYAVVPDRGECVLLWEEWNIYALELLRGYVFAFCSDGIYRINPESRERTRIGSDDWSGALSSCVHKDRVYVATLSGVHCVSEDGSYALEVDGAFQAVASTRSLLFCLGYSLLVHYDVETHAKTHIGSHRLSASAMVGRADCLVVAAEQGVCCVYPDEGNRMEVVQEHIKDCVRLLVSPNP